MAAAVLFGEIHGMIENAIVAAGGETTTQEIVAATNVDAVDFHHALADMVAVQLCVVRGGAVRILKVPPALAALIARSVPVAAR